MATQQMQVTIPNGMQSGQTFQVNANGQLMNVTVPAGFQGGQQLTITVRFFCSLVRSFEHDYGEHLSFLDIYYTHTKEKIFHF